MSLSRREFLKLSTITLGAAAFNPEGLARVVLDAPETPSPEALAPTRLSWPGKWQEVIPEGNSTKSFFLCDLSEGSPFWLAVNPGGSIFDLVTQRMKAEAAYTRVVTGPYPLLQSNKKADRLYAHESKKGMLGGPKQLSTFTPGWRNTGILSLEKFVLKLATSQDKRPYVEAIRRHKAAGDIPDLDLWITEFEAATKTCRLPSLDVLKILVEGAWLHQGIADLLQLMIQTQGSNTVESEAGIVQLASEKARFVTGGHFVARMLTSELPNQNVTIEQFPFGINSVIFSNWFGDASMAYEETSIVGGRHLIPSYDAATNTFKRKDFLVGAHWYVVKKNGEIAFLFSGSSGANYLKDFAKGLDGVYGVGQWQLIAADGNARMAIGIFIKDNRGVHLQNTMGSIGTYDGSNGGKKQHLDFANRNLIAYTIFPPVTKDNE